MDNILLFAGIASHIADQRGVQGREHDYLIHLRDAGSHVVPNHLRSSPFANQAQAFHTDSCDVIGMYVMETAKEGGQSYWASSGQVYNELAASRPDIIYTLAASNWPFERAGSEPPYALRALLHPSSHQPILCFSRSNLTGTNVAPRSPNIPQLSEIQAEALDALHYCAEKHAIEVKHRKGDMYFLNNLTVLHGRASFVDHDSASPIEPEASDEEPRGERHLMRLWLRDTEFGWQTPNGLQTRWSEVFGKEVRARGKWSFGKVHSASLVVKSQNDETSSFS
ncbi:hypothetical protein MMC11_006697 [Xylographa trunciseda]|nr:hypothetical protein [Xylographa trunciseda]